MTENGQVLLHFDNETGVKTYDSLADAMDAIADRINEEKEEKNNGEHEV